MSTFGERGERFGGGEEAAGEQAAGSAKATLSWGGARETSQGETRHRT